MMLVGNITKDNVMKTLLAAVAFALASGSALAFSGILQSEEVNGMLKYCKYSNGVIITVQMHEFCPMSSD